MLKYLWSALSNPSVAMKILKRQIFAPSPKYARALSSSNLLASVIKRYHKAFRPRAQFYSHLPIAVYDLRCSPVTFDFANFLYEADCFFQEGGYEEFQVIIVPKLENPYFVNADANYEQIITTKHRTQRIYSMLLPLASLYQSCSSINLIDNADLVTHVCRSHSNVYPQRYDGVFLRSMSYEKIYEYAYRRAKFSGFKAFPLDLEKVESWLDTISVARPFITFSIRHYAHQTSRNSNIDVYIEFAEYLSSLNISSVFIPDTEDLSYLHRISNYPVFFSGTFNVYQRQAIYELALTNIFCSSGTSTLCTLNKRCSYILSSICNEYWTVEMQESRGLRYGAQPFCENRGVWVWESETFLSLKKSFELLVQRNPEWQIKIET